MRLGGLDEVGWIRSLTTLIILNITVGVQPAAVNLVGWLVKQLVGWLSGLFIGWSSG